MLQFNFDGLPMFKSSSTELWPILCLVKCAEEEPFVAGFYCGKRKPQDLTEFLKDFVDELGNLIHMEVTINDKHFDIVVDCFVYDAPTRAFIKNIKYHSGYFGCDKCIDEGIMLMVQ